MPKKSSPVESTVEDHLVLKALHYGGVALKLRPPTGRGFPDRTVILPGHWVAFVELKRPVGGKIAVHQTSWSDQIRKSGGRFYFISTIAGVDEMFADYEKDRTKQCQ